MTRQELIDRKNFLITQKEKALGQANALCGAIEDCDYWLSRLDEDTLKVPA